MAALGMQKAMEQDSNEPQWRIERDRLLFCIPDQHSALLQVCMALIALAPDGFCQPQFQHTI